MDCSYKENWEQTIQNFIDWWNQEGLILDVGTVPRSAGLREPLIDPGLRDSAENQWVDVEWRVKKNHHDLSGQSFPGDTLPRADINLGAGSLALLLARNRVLKRIRSGFIPMRGQKRGRTSMHLSDSIRRTTGGRSTNAFRSYPWQGKGEILCGLSGPGRKHRYTLCAAWFSESSHGSD